MRFIDTVPAALWRAPFNSQVAGSAALYLHMTKSIGTTPSWYPNDVDIFIEDSGDDLSSLIPDLTEMPSHYKEAQHIRAVYSSPQYPHVQFILLRPQVTVMDAVTAFDLHLCQVVYNPMCGVDWVGCHNPAVHSHIIINDDMFHSGPGFITTNLQWARTHKRVLKYLKRGFTMTEREQQRLLDMHSYAARVELEDACLHGVAVVAAAEQALASNST